MRSRVVIVVIEVLVAGVFLAVVHPDLPHLLMGLCAVIAATVLITDLPTTIPPDLPMPPREDRDGARNDVSALAWSFLSRDNTVTPRAVDTTRDIAATRLRLHGIDLDDPAQTGAARDRLGAEAHDLLTRTITAPTMRQLGRTIDRLAALEAPARPPAHSTRTTR